MIMYLPFGAKSQKNELVPTLHTHTDRFLVPWGAQSQIKLWLLNAWRLGAMVNRVIGLGPISAIAEIVSYMNLGHHEKGSSLLMPWL